MEAIKKIVDNQKGNSFTVKLRRKRFVLFEKLVSTVPKPLRILDVGGTQAFWETMGFTHVSGVEILLFNLKKIEVSCPNFRSIIGNAINMSQFNDNEYDVVFSNSLIEHVGSYENQKRTAKEIRRVGKRYFVQTPNYYFPIEPHFLFPFFQYFPMSFRVFLVRHFKMGWYEKISDLQKAMQSVSRIRLLCEQELKELFPGGAIYKEKFFGLTKSFIIYDGWREKE